MYSIGMTYKLKPGCYAEYKKAHDELWPEIIENHEVNKINMVIYRYKDRLFLHATAPTEENWLKSREGDAMERWSEYMANLLVTDDENQIIFEDMEKVFLFGDYKQK